MYFCITQSTRFQLSIANNKKYIFLIIVYVIIPLQLHRSFFIFISL